MEIGTTSHAQPGATVKKDAATNINADFEMFLKLLTTQMTNQDPLNPMKAEEFATQLATFSGVEQQVRTNQLLGDMAAKANAADFAGMTQWIGKEVAAVMPVPFDGMPVTFTPPPAPAGHVHQLVVRDAAGAEIFRMTTDGTGAPVTWDGRAHTGGLAGAGAYDVTMESFSGNELVATAGVPVFAPVTEVRSGPTGVVLVTAGGGEVAGDAITAVRQARI